MGQGIEAALACGSAEFTQEKLLAIGFCPLAQFVENRIKIAGRSAFQLRAGEVLVCVLVHFEQRAFQRVLQAGKGNGAR